jgi:predicted RNA-binding Zn-ribbon protein involved in translation (DUF1610 family)
VSAYWWDDVRGIHSKMGHAAVFRQLSPDKLQELFRLRMVMIKEELKELEDADTPEKVVDAIIDLMVFGIGTLDAFDVDVQVAWDEVLQANLQKQPGVKEGRPNPFGLPDLIKPEGWCEPSHQFNVGRLSEIDFSKLPKRPKGVDMEQVSSKDLTKEKSAEGRMLDPKFALCPNCSSPLSKKRVEAAKANGLTVRCPDCGKEV